MIYFILACICTCLGAANGLGTSTLLRPLLDAVSPLEPPAVAMLCTAGTLSAALTSAFFMLSKPLPLHQDELLFLAIGSLTGGALGDLISARFFSVLSVSSAMLLQNALLFTILALPAVYFSGLSGTIRPLSITRMASLPAALLLGLLASFLSFGAVPLTLMIYPLLFDAGEDEASCAALTIALCAMAGKLIVMLIRLRLNLPHADILLWLLPGAILGTILPMVPGLTSGSRKKRRTLLSLSLFTALINIASALA
ncbi:MAG: hypothetical protein E7321_03135 [Clostridiales bacterium]|nr:hypothetical protein [Clostridiales bacterium]